MEGSKLMSRRSFTKVTACMVAGTLAMATGLATFPANAFAATTNKCYTISSSNTPVYSSAALSSKIGAIYGTDEVRINSFSANKAAANVTYPTARGSKTGWIRTGAILSATGGYGYKSKARFTTYKRPGGGNYGTVYVGDEVVVLGRSGSWSQFRYNVNGGYKFAWAYTGTVNSAIGAGGGGGQAQAQKADALASKAESQIGYQGTNSRGTGRGDYTKYGKFTGANGQMWCASFVSWCVNQAGVSTAVVPRTASTLTMAQKSNSYRAMTAASFKNMKRGDVVFFSTTPGLTSKGKKTVHHVGIVTGVNQRTGQVTMVEGNTSSDQVKRNSYTINASKSGLITKGYSGHYLCGYISVS